MGTDYSLRYLGHSQIDKKKWDHCITNAENGRIYAYSFYLDHMSPGWEALILNDYEAVFPIPWRRKWFVYYIYQPFIVAQLGLFGKQITSDLAYQFLKAIPKKFKYWDFSLNSANNFNLSHFPFYQRKNFVLPLHMQYEFIHKNYSQNVKRNIKKALRNPCFCKKDIKVNQVIELAKAYTPGITTNDADQIAKLFNYLKSENRAATYGVFSSSGELMASAVFFFSHKRAYYILVGNHPNGRSLGASHLLIDSFIKEHAGTELTLDFEGGDIQGLAVFYGSFGAQEENYPAIRLNQLPWYIKWLKK